MCGRFALGIPKKRLEEVFEAPVPDEYVPRYNMAPGHEVLVVEAFGGSRTMRFRKWGLVPHWAKNPSVGFKMTNARSETVFEKPAFRESVRHSRCLIPAQAFYEWKKMESGKQPYAIALSEQSVFAMAGIASQWVNRETGEIVESFSILTCGPNTLMESIHHRMPVILHPAAWQVWLAPQVSDTARLGELMVPYPAAAMCAWPVSTAVNKVVHDGPNLLDRVELLTQGKLF